MGDEAGSWDVPVLFYLARESYPIEKAILIPSYKDGEGESWVGMCPSLRLEQSFPQAK